MKHSIIGLIEKLKNVRLKFGHLKNKSIENLIFQKSTIEKYKIFRDEFYKDWIINIFKDPERETYKWSASPRYWLGLGYSNPLIGLTKLKEKTKPHKNLKIPLDIKNIKKYIDKFQLKHKKELTDLELKFKLKNFENNKYIKEEINK